MFWLIQKFPYRQVFCKLNINNFLDWTVLNEHSHKMNATSNLQCTNKYTVIDKMYPCIHQPKCVTFLALCLVVNFYHRNRINALRIILLPVVKRKVTGLAVGPINLIRAIFQPDFDEISRDPLVLRVDMSFPGVMDN